MKMPSSEELAQLMDKIDIGGITTSLIQSLQGADDQEIHGLFSGVEQVFGSVMQNPEMREFTKSLTEDL